MAVIQRWAEKCRGLGIRGRDMFCTLDGRRLKATYARTAPRRLAARAGIDKRVDPHSLRHCHAAELAAERIPINVVQLP